MNPLTIEWIEKAEGDYATAERELQVINRPNYDGVCFHAQQTVEKYLKAYLTEQGIHFPKTHSLIESLELSLSRDSSFESQRELLVRLEGYAVRYRYPGETAEKVEAQTAFQTAQLVREFIMAKLGLNKLDKDRREKS